MRLLFYGILGILYVLMLLSLPENGIQEKGKKKLTPENKSSTIKERK